MKTDSAVTATLTTPRKTNKKNAEKENENFILDDRRPRAFSKQKHQHNSSTKII